MEIITLTVGSYTGTAEINWFDENKWSTAHYEAFITVPFQDSSWENLFVYDKVDVLYAMEKAKQCLEMALLRCTLCG